MRTSPLFRTTIQPAAAAKAPIHKAALTGSTASPQHVKIKWADIGGPAYLKGQTPSVDPTLYPFDPKVVSAIQFQVFTNAQASTPYSFCVANLALLGK